MASVADRGEAGVGARGLSGDAYRGPRLLGQRRLRPPVPCRDASGGARGRCSSTASVACRPLARRPARLGRRGARFPWESAVDGSDVTPASARLPSGELVRDPHRRARGAHRGGRRLGGGPVPRLDGRRRVRRGAGTPTARRDGPLLGVPRPRSTRGGQAHIYGVIGPDEYHEPVDDNAFTNVMARWNLRRAAALDGIDEDERAEWLARGRRARRRLRPGNRPLRAVRGLPRARAARDRRRRASTADRGRPAARRRSGRAGAQVVKQADVLMLHHLIPDEVEPSSLAAEPRLLRAAHCPRQLALARDPRSPLREGAAASTRRSTHLLSRRASTSTTSPAPRPAGSTWRRWAGSGRRSPSDLPASARAAVACSSTRGCRRGGTALELALRFRGRPLRLLVDRRGVELDGDGLALRRVNGIWEVSPTMKKVLAALDESMAATPVLTAARSLAALLDSEVEAVHVKTDGGRRPERRRRPQEYG